MQINDLRLEEVKLCDRPHLLLWDTPNDLELREISYWVDADCISYRANLLVSQRRKNGCKLYTLPNLLY